MPARSRIHRRGPAQITAVLTPMIDLSFLLIVFFIVVSRTSERDIVRMLLPSPTAPRSVAADERQRAVVNIVGRDDQPEVIAAVRTGGREFTPDLAGREALAAHLAGLYRTTPELRLNVRADRRVQYRFIEPVLRAVSQGAAAAGVTPRVNLVIVRDGPGGGDGGAP